MLGKAMQFAITKHEGQVRKFSGKPYVSHPIKVAHLVSTFSKNKNLVAAAYLHDTVEDTNTTLKEIEETFNSKIADLVKELTSMPDGIKEFGKQEYLAKKMTSMSADALTIKLCDRLDNLSDAGTEKWKEKYGRQTRFILLRLENRSLTSIHKKIIERIRLIVGE